MRIKQRIKKRNQQQRKHYQLKVIRAIYKHEELHHQIWNELSKQNTFNKAP